MSNGKCAQSCFSCKNSIEENRNYACRRHEFIIPRIGMDTVCVNYENDSGNTLSESILRRIEDDGLYYYASVSLKWIFKLDDFRNLQKPRISGHILIETNGIARVMGLRVTAGYVEDLGGFGSLTIATSVGETNAISGPMRDGLEAIIKPENPKIIEQWLESEFYIDAINEALQKNVGLSRIVEKAGLPVSLEIVEPSRIVLHSNKLMFREILGDFGMAKPE